MMSHVGIQLFAREILLVIPHGDAVAQGFVHLQRQGAAQERLANQQQGRKQ